MKEAQPPELHYVYIVRCANDCLYTGYTKNVEQRIAVHNAGKGGRYTRAHRPVELVASWRFSTKRAAMQVEYAIKQLSRQQKIAISKSGEVPKWSCYQEAALLKG
jgi:putative endonuclease